MEMVTATVQVTLKSRRPTMSGQCKAKKTEAKMVMKREAKKVTKDEVQSQTMVMEAGRSEGERRKHVSHRVDWMPNVE